MEFVELDGCPCPASIAPYWQRILRRAGLHASSIYRGSDPRALPILRRNGKHTQQQMASASLAARAAMGITGTPNRPGRSTHELRSDAWARSGPVGRRLAEWQQPVDAGLNTDATRHRLREAAHHYGWPIEFPYTNKVEYHHVQFINRPRPKNPAQAFHIVRERRALRKATRR